ncbi:MAG: hypothetical protein ACK5PT_09095 [Cereibacter sp.]
MGTDAIRQAMEKRRDHDVGLENAETARDTVEAFVARNGLSGTDVRGIGDQRERSLEDAARFVKGAHLFVENGFAAG